MGFNGKPVEVFTSDKAVSTSNPFPVSIPAGSATPAIGRSKVAILRNSYGSTPVTTGAYVQLTASTAAEINHIQIFSGCASTLVLAVGAGGSEVDQIYIFPGGNGDVPLRIPVNSRVSVKAVDANATSGELLINCLS